MTAIRAPLPERGAPGSARRGSPWAASAALSFAGHGALIAGLLWGGEGLVRHDVSVSGWQTLDARSGGGPVAFVLPLGPEPQRHAGAHRDASQLNPVPAPRARASTPPLAPTPVQSSQAPARPPDVGVLLVSDTASAQESGAMASRATGGAGGGGSGSGFGGGLGPGTGREGDYISVASPRALILPPLGRVPGAVAGRTFRIRFWVAADGRVTRVDIDPPIPDAGYRQDLLERMLAYQFYPARTQRGTAVASVVTVPLRIGN